MFNVPGSLARGFLCFKPGTMKQLLLFILLPVSLLGQSVDIPPDFRRDQVWVVKTPGYIVNYADSIVIMHNDRLEYYEELEASLIGLKSLHEDTVQAMSSRIEELVASNQNLVMEAENAKRNSELEDTLHLFLLLIFIGGVIITYLAKKKKNE